MQRLVLLFLGWAIACANLLAQSTATVSGTVKVMGAKNSADVVVYVESVNGPMTVEPPAQPAVIDQRQKVFIPHVLPIVKGTAVTFLNSDDLLHNVHARQDRRSLFNVGMPFKDYKITRKFAKPGEVVLLCDVHAEMSAYIIVLETPYFATTDADGKFTIENVSEGNYVLKTWHETKAPLSQEITVSAAAPVELDLTLRQKK